MKDETIIRENKYQADYSSLRDFLSEIPMTEYTRDTIQRCLDDMEQTFREANLYTT